ncbi:MAG: nucleotidyl transferase AbiEii/AbiGii toxin family protein, partial [candidate division KSB1 bacterium]|nr:nucleotidyl transferase AbiEii/AbiGii toxin family protein [candidate division KSB1 bacterium]
MKLVDGLGTPFYLSGGTALSRHYFNHRYSDDLDFFLNNDSAYPEFVRLIFSALENAKITNAFRLDYLSNRRSENYTQIICVATTWY